MNSFGRYWQNIASGLMTTLIGMAATMRHAGRREYTLEYPEKRDVLPPRSRMSLFMNADECIACSQCVRACPVGCISIKSEKRPKDQEIPLTVVGKKKKALVLTEFKIDMAKCCYCGSCVDPCPTHCLYMTPHFELSVAQDPAEATVVRMEGETSAQGDMRRARSRVQTQHPLLGRTGLVYDFIAITDDLHRRGEHVPENPLYREEYSQILGGPVPVPERDAVREARGAGGVG